MYGERDNFGVAQRAIIELFDSLDGNADVNDGDVDMDNQESSDTDTVIDEVEMSNAVHVAVYQIYNENVNDLLGNPKVNMKTR